MTSAKNTPVSSRANATRRGAQAVGAAVISLGLVGTFSLPANAVTPGTPGTEDISMADFSIPDQALQTAEAEAALVPVESPDGELSAAYVEQQRAEAEKKKEEEAARAAEEKDADDAADTGAALPLGKDIPAGKGAQGIVNAAKAQLGVAQDCTDLVQNSLAAIGVIDRRDMGGFDLGPSSAEHVALGGSVVTSGEYAPGDILFWEGRHNAVYIGDGKAVHGGYGGNQTVIATAFLDGPPDTVVRFS